MSDSKLVNGSIPIQRRYINSAVVGQPQLASNPATGSLCVYKQQYPAPVLEKPSDWNLGIVRFDIPFLRTPRFIDPSADGSGVPCTMTWTNPGGPLSTSTQRVSAQLLSYTIDPFNTSAFYLAQQWVDVLQAAMNALATSTGLSTHTPAPMVTYDASSNLLSISATRGTFYPAVGGQFFVGTVNMYINAALWRMLPSLPGEFIDYTSLGLSSDYYYRIRLGSSSGSIGTLQTGLPNFGPNGAPVQLATLTTGLTQGSVYTRLNITNGSPSLFFFGPGQALVLNDPISGSFQTVFADASSSQIAITGQLNTLMFTAAINFPATTSLLLIYSVNQLVLNAPVTIPILKGTVLNCGITTTTTVQTTPVGSQLLNIEPTFTQAQGAGTIVYMSEFDTIITETPVVSSWTSISAVRLKTLLIPINAEMSPDILTGSNSSAGTSTAQLNLVQQVSDFTIDQATTIVTNNIVQFVSEQPRWIDMIGDNPLTAIDFTATWVDMQGMEHSIYCPQGLRFDVKTEFKRKDTKCLPGL